jgi:hypothetical protein
MLEKPVRMDPQDKSPGMTIREEGIRLAIEKQGAA